MIMHIHHLVHDELRPFSYLDFLKFDVDGHEFKMTHGTFRNNISRLVQEGLIEISYKSNITFYTLKGTKFHKASRIAMTGDHTGVPCSSRSVSASAISSNPLYRLLMNLPLDKSSVHDIHLRFSSPQIYAIISLSISNKVFGSDSYVNSRSRDILLPVWKIRNLLIRATIHKTDTVSIVIGCSLNPIILDANGIIRLTNALSIVEERLSRLVEQSLIVGCFKTIEDIDSSSRYHDILPSHSEWIVTMWHFGADALIEYSGEKFSVTWETAESTLVRAYSKMMNDHKTRIRLERQGYPKATLADIIEQRLSGEKGS